MLLLTERTFQPYPERAPFNSQAIVSSFDLNEILVKKLFNIVHHGWEILMKPTLCTPPYISRRFQRYQEAS
jgi:hypothetical protein